MIADALFTYQIGLGSILTALIVGAIGLVGNRKQKHLKEASERIEGASERIEVMVDGRLTLALEEIAEMKKLLLEHGITVPSTPTAPAEGNGG